MRIRACNPHNFQRLMEYDEKTDKIDGLLGSLIGDFLSLVVGQVRQQLGNVTVEVQAKNLGVGEFKEQLGRFDGCLGELQVNRSDMMLQLSPYPSDIENVSQGLVLFETGLSFASGYSKTQLGGAHQLLDSFNSFSPSLWALCLVTCLFMSMFLCMYQVFYKWAQGLLRVPGGRSYCNVYQVITHCCRCGAIFDGRFQRRVLFLCASLYSLVVVHYFCSLIKTELVVVKDPILFNSYDDIIKRNATPLFVRGTSYDRHFKLATAEPHRKKLWKYAVESHGEKRLYIDVSPLIFMLVSVSIMSQTAVVFLEDTLMPLVLTSGCSLAGRDMDQAKQFMHFLEAPDKLEGLLGSASSAPDEEDWFIEYCRNNQFNFKPEEGLLVHISRDPNEQLFHQGLIFNHLANEKLLKSMIRATRRLSEHGFVSQQRISIEKLDIFKKHEMLDTSLGPILASRRREVDECRSKSIIKPTISFSSIQLGNLRTLLVLMGCIFAACLFILVLEVAVYHLKASKLKGSKSRRRKGKRVAMRSHLAARIARRAQLEPDVNVDLLVDSGTWMRVKPGVTATRSVLLDATLRLRADYLTPKPRSLWNQSNC